MFLISQCFRHSLNDSHLRKTAVSSRSHANTCSPGNLQNHRFLVKNKFFQIICSWLNMAYIFKFKDTQTVLFSV